MVADRCCCLHSAKIYIAHTRILPAKNSEIGTAKRSTAHEKTIIYKKKKIK